MSTNQEWSLTQQGYLIFRVPRKNRLKIDTDNIKTNEADFNRTEKNNQKFSEQDVRVYR